ncbi:MAG: helix-turn-helix transcriptional regulator [Actinomycetota bacterium]
MSKRLETDPDRAIYIISVAAELAGVHPQTLRVYERKGLLQPQRTQGNTRRYSQKDIELLQRIQELTTEGINLAGVMRVLELEDQIEKLRTGQEHAATQVSALTEQLTDLLGGSSALVLWRDERRVRRALKSDLIDEAAGRRTFPSPPISG